MGADGRQTEDGGIEGPGAENVVRLPTDWLGPREDLVPFGAAGRARAAADMRDPSQVLPPAAHDFWGEDSAALHDAMRAPESGSVNDAYTASSAPRPDAGRRAGLRTRLALALPAAALIIVSTVAMIEGGSRSATGGIAAKPAVHQVARVDQPALTPAEPSAATRIARPQSPERSGSHRRTTGRTPQRPARVRAFRQRQSRLRSSSRRRRPAPQPVGSPAQPVRTAVPAYTTVSNSAPTASSGSGSSSTPASLAGSSSGGSSSAPSGPVGQGAPFGPGHLG